MMRVAVIIRNLKLSAKFRRAISVSSARRGKRESGSARWEGRWDRKEFWIAGWHEDLSHYN